MNARQRLQVTYLWNQLILGHELLRAGDSATIGAARRTTFVTPRLSGFPRRFRLLSPIRDGFRLRLGPGMSGQLSLRGEKRSVGEVLAQPGVRRFLRDPGMFRETELYPGDTAQIALDAEGTLRLQISFTDAPETIGRPRNQDHLMAKTRFATSVATLALLAVILILGDQVRDDVTISAERYAQVVAPVVEQPKMQAATEKQKVAVAERERKRKEKEAAESKRMKEKEGRLGRADAKQKDTIMPKGREDIIRDKVAKTGLLAALGSSRAPSSGLSKLFASDSLEMEQAVNGFVGARLTAGRGSGGMGLLGTGPGGGGTGSGGRILGSGNLNVGAGSGRGRKGPGLGTGKEREVQVGVTTGTADAEGGLTREQVNRVVRAHVAAIKYCYDKELQRAPSLAGRIDVFWVIRPNGSVDRTKIAESTMGNRAVEGCIERQVKNWQFPRSDAETIVQKYPFIFSNGS